MYMDTLRADVKEFLHNHNDHRIRSQPKRSEYLQTGKPSFMYKHPKAGIKNYGKPPDLELLNTLQREIAAYNPDEYIHPESLRVCIAILRENNLPITPGPLTRDHAVHRTMYLALREGLLEYEENGDELPEIELPQEGKTWVWQDEQLRQSRDELWEVISKEMMEENDTGDIDVLLAGRDNSADLEYDRGEGNEEGEY